MQAGSAAQFNVLCPSFASTSFCQEKQLFKENSSFIGETYGKNDKFYHCQIKDKVLKADITIYDIFGERSTPVPLTAELFCHQRNKIF